MPNIMARTKAVMIIIFEFMCAEPTFIFLCVSEDLIIRACSSIDVGCTALEGVISLTVSFFNSIHVTFTFQGIECWCSNDNCNFSENCSC